MEKTYVICILLLKTFQYRVKQASVKGTEKPALPALGGQEASFRQVMK